MLRQYSDETLVYMTLSGEQRAYEELVYRYQSRVLSSASAVLKSVYLSEDAAQDAFIAAWMKLDTLTDPSKFGAWVCNIARNRAKNMALRYRPWIDIDGFADTLTDERADVSPERVIIENEEKEQLHKALSELPEKVKNVIYLHYFEGLSVAEIAERTSASVGTVKWRLSDGRKRLRGELSAMDENANDTLLQRVMKKVEELKLWSAKTNKKDFYKDYGDVLNDVVSLPESESKYHAMADVLLRGFWWIPGNENDEMLARIKEAAERGGNDEATSFIYAKEDEKLSGDAKIEFIRDKQIPSIDGEKFPLTLGNEWYEFGREYFRKNEREKGFEAYGKALEILPADSVRRALAVSAAAAEREYDEVCKDKPADTWMLSSSAYEFDIGCGDPVLLSTLFGGHLPSTGDCVCRHISLISWYGADGVRFISGKKPGHVYTGTDNAALTFISDSETVKTPAGVFDNCELWEQRGFSEFDCLIFLTYYKRGVGIVKRVRRVIDEEETVVLRDYKVKESNDLLPLNTGNEWTYECGENTNSVVDKINFKVCYNNGKKAVAYINQYAERLYFDENSFSDMAYAAQEKYFTVKDGTVHDVWDYVKKMERAAKTKAEKVHARTASSVMNRIMNETSINPDRQYDNMWNFFNCYVLYEKDGDLFFGYAGDFPFELKNGENGSEPLLYNGLYLILQDNAGCLWSEQWADGYTVSKELQPFYDTTTKLTLRCEKCGAVELSCGSFDDCVRIILETTGFKTGHDYIGGKKVYTFAKGIGIIKTENYYNEDVDCAVYELTEYEGTGDGYFPYADGMRRRYELKNDNERLIGYAEYEYVADKSGRIAVFTDRRGSIKKKTADKYYVTTDEQKASELWEKRDFDAYHVRQGVVNLNIQLHALTDGAPVNMYDGRMPAAFNQFAMRLMESFGEDGKVPEIWYGYYAHKSFIAAAALFSLGKKDEAVKHLDTGFEYIEKWMRIPSGTELPLGAPWLFGNIRLKKDGSVLLLPDGTKEAVYDPYIFKQRDMSYVYTALTGWGWFDPVRGEPLFREYVERAEKAR